MRIYEDTDGTYYVRYDDGSEGQSFATKDAAVQEAKDRALSDQALEAALDSNSVAFVRKLAATERVNIVTATRAARDSSRLQPSRFDREFMRRVYDVDRVETVHLATPVAVEADDLLSTDTFEAGGPLTGPFAPSSAVDMAAIAARTDALVDENASEHKALTQAKGMPDYSKLTDAERAYLGQFAPSVAERRFEQCDNTCTVDCGHCKGMPDYSKLTDAERSYLGQFAAGPLQ